MSLTHTEIIDLQDWIHENVFGWHCAKELEFPFRAGWLKDGEEFCLDCDMSNYPEDPADAMAVLKKCAEKIKNGIVGIGSPMGEAVATNVPREKQGWVVGKIGKPNNFDVEAETFELAICQFAKKLFGK